MNTTENGTYWLLVDAGGWNWLIGQKHGYFDHLKAMELIKGVPVEHNFSMIPTYDLPSLGGVGFIAGNESGYILGFNGGNITGFNLGNITGFVLGNSTGFNLGNSTGFNSG